MKALKDYGIDIYERLYLYFLRRKRQKAYGRAKGLPSPVISVGNLTLGGTGKTPMVIEISKEAQKRGLNVCILSRGYKGRLPGPVIVSCKTGPLVDEIDVGDEPILMAERLPGIPVVTGKDRYKAGIYALQCFKEKPDLFLLDDGYQHWYLKRDIDILLVSGLNPFGNRRLFPFGPLREPLEEMKRADIIVITLSDKAKDLDGLLKEIHYYNCRAPVYLARHVISSVLRYRIGNDGRAVLSEKQGPSGLKGKEVFAFCGIGNPLSFRLSLEEIGVRIVDFVRFRDHYRYKVCDLEELSKKASKSDALLVTTEKDLIRANGRLPPGEIYTLTLSVEISTVGGTQGEMFFDELFKLLPHHP